MLAHYFKTRLEFFSKQNAAYFFGARTTFCKRKLSIVTAAQLRQRPRGAGHQPRLGHRHFCPHDSRHHGSYTKNLKHANPGKKYFAFFTVLRIRIRKDQDPAKSKRADK